MTGYSHARNSVDDLFFELLKDMPENLPLHLRLGEGFLRQMVRQHPTVTLQQYCQMIEQQRGITISLQTMCKLLVRIGMPGHIRRQVATAPSETLAA